MSPAPKALLVSYTAALGGAERLLLDWSTALDDAVVACPEPLAGAARAQGLQVVPIRARRLELRTGPWHRVAAPLRIAAQAGEIRRAVRDLRPHVVVGWGARALLSCTAAARGLRPRPKLVFQHNDLLPGPAVARTVRAAARRADAVVCISRAIASDLALNDRVEVITPGVDLERFSPPPAPPSDPRVLVLAAIVDWKRPDLALEIGALAARSAPALRLRLAGAPLGEGGEALLARLRERARSPDLAGRVELPGRALDAREALIDASCLLHCADREPYGIALVEALACGVPVVAPAEGGPLELVDETCGALYPPGDAPAGAEALLRVLAAPEMRAAARARAVERFDRQTARRRYRELISSIAS